MLHCWPVPESVSGAYKMLFEHALVGAGSDRRDSGYETGIKKVRYEIKKVLTPTLRRSLCYNHTEEEC